jgi:hypothetical protein
MKRTSTLRYVVHTTGTSNTFELHNVLQESDFEDNFQDVFCALEIGLTDVDQKVIDRIVHVARCY